MPEKIIIFDFDGTIADSRNTLVEIANRLAAEFFSGSLTCLKVRCKAEFSKKSPLNLLIAI